MRDLSKKKTKKALKVEIVLKSICFNKDLITGPLFLYRSSDSYDAKKFVKDKVYSSKLGLSKKQTENLISELSYTCEKYPDTDLDVILTGIKERNIYYDSWIRNINVMN